MRTPLLFLKIVGKAALHCMGLGGVWDLVEEIPELADKVWDDWQKNRNQAQRKADLEAVATVGDDVAADVKAIVDEIAADRPEPVRQALGEYLAQIPATVRQTLRRPADPAGRTVPPALEPRSARDLIPFLDAHRPRFQAGDRPVAGSDWVLAELLGIGGYGEVWKARHVHIDDFEPVALKFCTDPEARERLLKHEAKLCAQVQREGRHPGIVALRHTFLSADPPCLEYEYVEGGTLATLIKGWANRDPKPTPEEITRHFLKIVEIVAFAHRLDPPIVHRDLKPANILIAGTNGATQFKITDFGIGGIATAAVIRENRQPSGRGLLLTKSMSGSYTPLYASPEQAAGGPPDTCDDVHSLGVIWHQMLTGDLTTGRPGGSTWRRKLADRGMSGVLIDLLEACFDEMSERPVSAAVLAEGIRSGLAADGSRLPDLMEAILLEPEPPRRPNPLPPDRPAIPEPSRLSNREEFQVAEFSQINAQEDLSSKNSRNIYTIKIKNTGIFICFIGISLLLLSYANYLFFRTYIKNDESLAFLFFILCTIISTCLQCRGVATIAISKGRSANWGILGIISIWPFVAFVPLLIVLGLKNTNEDYI